MPHFWDPFFYMVMESSILNINDLDYRSKAEFMTGNNNDFDQKAKNVLQV